MTPLEKLGAAIETALDECPIEDVMSVITGACVALVVAVTEQAGHDTNRDITISHPNNNRDITIHTKNESII